MVEHVQSHRYHHVTRTGTYGFLAALPLMLLYELLVVSASRSVLTEVRIGAEVWLKQMLFLVGDMGMIAFGMVVILVGIGVFWYERRKRIPIRPWYFVWMILESAGYAVVLGWLVANLVQAMLVAPAGQVQPDGVFLRLVLSIGAGIYEELLFRVLLVGALFVVLRWMLGGRVLPYVVAAVVGAFAFSLVHYIGPYGDTLETGSFLFRMFMGLGLNVLFLVRGFGVAAWTHALYDVMVVLVLQGGSG